MRKFWSWAENEAGRVLRLDGVIAEETWWDDEVTPNMFRKEIEKDTGDIIVWINSPGGDVFAAAQIYNMIKEYAGTVIVKIDGLAASAASVVAMAGDIVQMTPVSMMMIHNPATVAIGDSEEMLKAKKVLDEIKESIINAYELKTGLSRIKISHMMTDETWLNAYKAVDLGFADSILYTGGDEADQTGNPMIYSRMAVTNSLFDKFKIKNKGLPINQFYKRLELLK